MKMKLGSFNYSTAIGISLSLLLFAFIIFVNAHDSLAFFNLPSLLIIVLGTLAAVSISYPLRDITYAFTSTKHIFFYESLDPKQDAEEIIRVAHLWFNHDMVGIENLIDHINNYYLKIGFQMIIDNTPLDDILTLLKWRTNRLRAKEQVASNVFHSMATFSPAFGMVGTLVSLINMLQIITDKDIHAIAFNMGVALITTFYGLMFANLVFNPMAVKLERRTEQRVMIMSMVMEGITLIAEKRTPAYIRETLASFIVNYENELQR